ncbi:MAG: class I SAM-dependent methyltransferase [Armatimonadetes bacterium]|nr:class I SAM-dependent methyltransferase [Armatimonadota bacterium]
MPSPTFVVTTSQKADPALRREALEWAERLSVEFVPRRGRSLAALCAGAGVEAALTVTHQRVGLVMADGSDEYFFHPNTARMRLHNIDSAKGDPMVTAMELGPGDTVLDCTLGRASDAIVAARQVGARGRVIGYEADKLVAALTIHGLATYRIEGRGIQEAMRRIEAHHGDCEEVLPALADDDFDVVYFDPFFDETVEQSQAMASLRRLGVHRDLAPGTFEHALRVARRCVVIKQRKGGPYARLPDVIRIVGGGNSRIEYVVLGDPFR